MTTGRRPTRSAMGPDMIWITAVNSKYIEMVNAMASYPTSNSCAITPRDGKNIFNESNGSAAKRTKVVIIPVGSLVS